MSVPVRPEHLPCGNNYQRVEPFDLPIEFVADVMLQDQSRVAVATHNDNQTSVGRADCR